MQTEILTLLAAHRSPESFVAGAAALNVGSPRYSGDIDIFHDREEGVAKASEADIAVLDGKGFTSRWLRREPGFHAAIVAKGGQDMKLEWVEAVTFASSPPSKMNCLVTACTSSISPPTRRSPPPGGANHATSSISSTSMSGI
jgi:hypothetical protein